MKGKLADLDVIAMFSQGAEVMIDAFLREHKLTAEKEKLNKTTGLLYELYLTLYGVLSVDELDETHLERLGVPRADIRWKESFPPALENPPCIVFLHGMGGNNRTLRRQLLPLLLKAKVRAIFIEGGMSVGKKGKSYVQRSAEGAVVNPMAVLHTVANKMKNIAESGITIDGIYGFSQGAIIAGLIAAGWAKNLLPKIQAAPLKLIIAQCGSELDWRTTLPRCFEGTPITIPALVSFGKKDRTRFGTKKQTTAFSSWFDNATCTRVDHTASHQPLPSNTRMLGKHLDALDAFINTHAGQQVNTANLEV